MFKKEGKKWNKWSKIDSITSSVDVLVGALPCWQFVAISPVWLKPCARCPSAVRSWVVGDVPQLSEFAKCVCVCVCVCVLTAWAQRQLGLERQGWLWRRRRLDTGSLAAAALSADAVLRRQRLQDSQAVLRRTDSARRRCEHRGCSRSRWNYAADGRVDVARLGRGAPPRVGSATQNHLVDHHPRLSGRRRIHWRPHFLLGSVSPHQTCNKCCVVIFWIQNTEKMFPKTVLETLLFLSVSQVSIVLCYELIWRSY